MRWIEVIGDLLKLVIDAIRAGKSDDQIADEIAERLAEPGSVGQHLLDAAKRRKAKLADFKRGAP